MRERERDRTEGSVCVCVWYVKQHKISSGVRVYDVTHTRECGGDTMTAFASHMRTKGGGVLRWEGVREPQKTNEELYFRSSTHTSVWGPTSSVADVPNFIYLFIYLTRGKKELWKSTQIGAILTSKKKHWLFHKTQNFFMKQKVWHSIWWIPSTSESHHL